MIHAETKGGTGPAWSPCLVWRAGATRPGAWVAAETSYCPVVENAGNGVFCDPCSYPGNNSGQAWARSVFAQLQIPKVS